MIRLFTTVSGEPGPGQYEALKGSAKERKEAITERLDALK